jgi:alpha-beta hydrolase superfamily lysophospholipase
MLKTKDGLDLATYSWKVADPKAILVLTHGYNDHANRYVHVAQALNAAGYSLYSYDIRGHGKSGGQRGHTPSFDTLLDDLQMVVEDAHRDAPGKKVFVYGHSMGGNITLNYAIRRPEGLSGVIATSPWLKLTTEPPAALAIAVKVLNAILPNISIGSGLSTDGISRDEAVRTAYANDPLLHGKISPHLLTEILNNGLAALSQADKLKLPLLLIHGTADSVTSAPASQEFYKAVSGDKTLKLYEGMFHETQNEPGKEQVFADMAAWLDGHV